MDAQYCCTYEHVHGINLFYVLNKYQQESKCLKQMDNLLHMILAVEWAVKHKINQQARILAKGWMHSIKLSKNREDNMTPLNLHF